MSSVKRTRRKDKRSGESSTVSGTGGSHLSSDSESPIGRTTSHRKSGRLLRKKLRKHQPFEQAYDGDKENSSESSPSSSTPQHTDEYEFDEVDVVIPLIEKSNKKQKVIKKAKSTQRKVGDKLKISCAKKTDTKMTRILSSTPVDTNINNTTRSGLKRKDLVIEVTSESNPKKRTKRVITPILHIPMTDSSSDKTKSMPSIVRRSKRKIADSVNMTPAIPKGHDTESDKVDSGMFVSPPPRKLLRLTAKDTSTPTDTSKSDCNFNPEIKMGLDESVSLLFSPVEKVKSTPSPTSDYGSVVSCLSQFSLIEGDNIPKALFEPEEDEAELKVNKSMTKGYKGSKVKIKKHKNRHSVSKVDAWAVKVNEDFDEIEKFELSIEG